MSLKSINIIHELVRQREGLDENAQRILERVKGGFESADGEVFLVNISDDQGGFQLSSEADVLKGVPATTPGGAAATGTPSPVAELKRQLRFVLASHELVRTWQYTSLDEVISALMVRSPVRKYVAMTFNIRRRRPLPRHGRPRHSSGSYCECSRRHRRNTSATLFRSSLTSSWSYVSLRFLHKYTVLISAS